MAYAGLLFAPYSPEISLGADHQHKVSLFNFCFAPGGPALGWKLDVLIYDRVYAVGTQPVGQFEHAVAVLRAVVTVADEDPWWRRFGHRRYSSPSISMVFWRD